MGLFIDLLRYSRINSNTITVSVSEYKLLLSEICGNYAGGDLAGRDGKA